MASAGRRGGIPARKPMSLQSWAIATSRTSRQFLQSCTRVAKKSPAFFYWGFVLGLALKLHSSMLRMLLVCTCCLSNSNKQYNKVQPYTAHPSDCFKECSHYSTSGSAKDSTNSSTASWRGCKWLQYVAVVQEIPRILSLPRWPLRGASAKFPRRLNQFIKDSDAVNSTHAAVESHPRHLMLSPPTW